MSKLIMLFCLALLGSGCVTGHKRPDGTIEYASKWFTSDDADVHESTSGAIGIAHHAIDSEVPVSVRKDGDGNFAVSVGTGYGYGGYAGYNPYVPHLSQSEADSYYETLEGRNRREAASRGMLIAPSTDEGDADKSAMTLEKLGAKVDAVGKKVDVIASEAKGTKKVTTAVLEEITTGLDVEKK